jgi:hypothetical protein
MSKFTVTFTDGETQEFEVPSFSDGSPKLHQMEPVENIIKDMVWSLSLIAGIGILPNEIVDDQGKHYYCEWSVNIVPCPEVSKKRS